MTAAGPLIVPMQVEAFVVNDQVRDGWFVRAQMQYGRLGEGRSAQPVLGDRDMGFGQKEPVPPHQVSASDYYNGVYLKWRLPRAFTHGVQHSATAELRFRPIPNRWIVVRSGGPPGARAATAWIIESDYVWPAGDPQPAQNVSQVSSLYVQGSNGTPPVAVYMGRNVPLGSWTEPGTSQRLTAIAPGNPAFAFYQPQNNNILSFVDVLAGAPAQALSYQVFGWFSAADEDPLAEVSEKGFAQVLDELGWTLPKDTDPTLTASWSLLNGYVNCVEWQTATAPPSEGPASADSVSIAAGNTAVEALTALVTAQAAAKGVEVDAELLEAFQLDLLPELDQPDGAALLAEKLHTSCFQRFSGGYSWEIVAPPGAPAVSDEELAKELSWLTELNEAQATLDADLRLLASLQAELYEFWWKYESWPEAYHGQTVVKGPNGPLARADLLEQLQPTTPGTIACRVKEALEKVKADAAAVPGGATQEALEKAIAKYAAERGLPPRLLKRSASPGFYEPDNPVVLIAGAGAAGIAADPGAPVCRFPRQLVAGFKWRDGEVTASTEKLTVPRAHLSGVSGAPWSSELAGALADEAFFLDPGNASAIAAAVGGTAEEIEKAIASSPLGVTPVAAVAKWSANPWRPLLLLWRASYHWIEYGSADSPNWSFENGRYVWSGAGGVGSTSFGGLVQLSPAASFNMAARLESFLASHPQLDPRELGKLEELLKFVRSPDHPDWDLLSQALDGFNEQVRLGTPGAFKGPESTPVVTNPPLSALIGDQDSYPPGLGNVPKRQLPPSEFQPWRAGQFSFSELIVIDEWGQALWPISEGKKDVSVSLPAGMTPVLVSEPVGFTVTKDGLPDEAEAATTPATGPAITSLSPGVFLAGSATSAEIPLTVDGVGFTDACEVQWDGEPLRTAFKGPTELEAAIPASFLAAPGKAQVTVVASGSSSPAATFVISPGAAIETLTPASAVAGSKRFTLTAEGVGFEPGATLTWNGVPLDTRFVSPTQLTAEVPADHLAEPGLFHVAEQFGHSVLPTAPETLAQLPPTLPQPARLDFEALSGRDDSVVFGPTAPDADPICGWVLPNHLDSSLMAYGSDGSPLGEMSVGIGLAGDAHPCWDPAPGSRFKTLAEIAAAMPHFGPFLETLGAQTAATFSSFLAAIDETLWTTLPMDAVFDQNLAVLIGRPLAMMRARLRFELFGLPRRDPSWRYTFEQQPELLAGYRFPIELGNIAQLDDGLIGYFVEDDYDLFNVVQQAGAEGSDYLRPIGKDGNYPALSFDGTSAAHLSMLVDPRAPVHATTAILPDVTLALPQRFVAAALAGMDVTFRLDGVLTDQQIAKATLLGAETRTVRLPTPAEKEGAWSWLEKGPTGWTAYPTEPNDATARLEEVPPVLRRGLLRLSSIEKGVVP